MEGAIVPKMSLPFSWGCNMQGIFINGKRPKSKKQVKEACAAISFAEQSKHAVKVSVFNTMTIGAVTAAKAKQRAPYLTVEATSLFGNEFDGPVNDLPVGGVVFFVGPDPYRSRKFYGKLVRKSETLWVVS
jgi:hypothetical protein